MNYQNGFGEWFADLQRHLGLTDTEMAATLGASEAAVRKWKSGNPPSKARYLDKLVELSGEDRSKVFGLAGRGTIDMDTPGLDPVYRDMAFTIQEVLSKIEDPIERQFAHDELVTALNQWKQGRERINDLLLELRKRGEVAQQKSTRN